MSTNPPPNRWRSGANTPQARTQQSNPTSNTSSRDRAFLSNTSRPTTQPTSTSPASNTAPIPTPAPVPASNVWANRGRAPSKPAVPNNATAVPTSASGIENSKAATPLASAPKVAAPEVNAGGGPAEEKQGSVSSFNAEEVKDYLKREYQAAIAGDTSNKSRYQPPTSDNSNSATSSRPAWGSKPTTMANGADFWTQLKKQILSKESGG